MKSSGHVLVVDDNQANRELASAHLAAAGYSVTVAESGEKALELFAQRTPDLILLDVMMPGLDGFETCKRLRASPGGHDVAIVFITALTDLGSHQRAMASGADDFLTKPLNRTELLLRARSLLWIRRLKEELRDGYDLIRTQRDALILAQQQREALTSLVVHDLKNPLTAILFNAQWLAEECAGEEAQCAKQLVSAANSMHRLVMDLLDISRSEDGMLVPRLTRLDLETLVKKTAAAQTLYARQQVQVTAQPLELEADADLLRRLLENLLDNARKYSPAESTIHVALERVDDQWIELRVEDEGAGIPAPLRERVFDKYTRLDPEAGEHFASSRGLGLTFCKLAAEVHGGSIWVDQSTHGGSAFHVRLPLASLRPESASAA